MYIAICTHEVVTEEDIKWHMEAYGVDRPCCNKCGKLVREGGRIDHLAPYDDLMNRCKGCLEDE